MKEIRTLRTSVAEIKLLKEDFIRIEYSPNIIIDLPELEENLQAYKKLLGNDRFYLLSVIPPGVTVSEKARNYWTKPERSKFKIAEAFVINKLSHALLANFVTTFQPPRHELKFFNSEKKALAWLDTKMK